MVNLVILGAGGFGREMHGWLRHAQAAKPHAFRIKGFLDDNPTILSGIPDIAPIIGNFSTYQLEETDHLVCALGNPLDKLRVCAQWKQRGARFFTFVHPTAVIGERVRLGEGTIVCPGVVLTSDIEIGEFVTLNVGSSVGHDARIGRGSTLSGHADVTGKAELGEGVFLGSHAVVAPGVKIGDGSRVGAGSVAIKNVADRSVVFGVPAKFLMELGKNADQD